MSAHQVASDVDSELDCPQCDGAVFRVPRRFVDLLLSRFIPVYRYRCCGSLGCHWEGNLRMKYEQIPQ